MKAIFLVVLIYVMLALGQAHAQQLSIRGGEHDDFTRLVVRIPSDREWEITNEAGRTSVIFEDFQGEFLVNRVFARVPRTRLLDVEPKPNGFDLILNCLCPVESFIADGSYLALDILDGPALPVLSEETAIGTAEEPAQLPTSRFGYGDLLWIGDQTLYNPDDATAESIEQLQDIEQFIEEAEGLVDVRRRLLEEFSMAAARGIVSPNMQNLQPPDEPDQSDPVVEILDSSSQMLPEEPDLRENLRVTSSGDFPAAFRNFSEQSKENNCTADKKLAIEDWMRSDENFSAIGQVRAGLYDAVDGKTDTRIVKLARIYLHFAMGPEARRVLEMSDSATMANPELVDMAEIFEYGYSRNPRILHQGLSCNGDAALWAVLSASIVPKEQKIDVDAVLRAISDLPLHLRQVLVPSVSQRLLAYGDVAASEAALRALTRAPVPVAENTLLATAALELTDGNATQANQSLNILIEEGSALTPQALINLIESKIADGSSLEPDLALLIDAYAFELSSGPMGDDLLFSSVVAAAKSGQFERSFYLFKENKSKLGIASRSSELGSILLNELTYNSGDAEFITNFFKSYNDLPSNLDNESQRALADRLLKLGFPDAAFNVISSIEADARDQILEAKILIRTGSPASALERLVDITGERVDRTAAQAHQALGNNGAAHLLYSELKEEENSLFNAWLSSDWKNYIDYDTPTFGQLKSISSNELTTILPERGMLNSLGELLLESEAARRSILASLSQITVE